MDTALATLDSVRHDSKVIDAQPTVNTADFLTELSQFIFTSKYARYNEKEHRRETWEETVDRVYQMHLRKFRKLHKDDLAKIRWAFEMVREQKVVPSMRSMQFGGTAIEAHHARTYNCAVRHIDSIRSFSEVFYLLLCGCGVGIGLTRYFLSRLPNLVDASDRTGTVITYVIEDTIEGWADSVEALLNCYFKNTAYTGRKIVFDYSKIRPAGSPLKTSGGKAPGYKGLKNCHIKIKSLLDRIIENLNQTRLKSINAYDILMHTADATLSGGVRRSATDVIFDRDDEDMMNAKTYFTVEKHSRFAFDEETNKYHGRVKVGGEFHEVEISEHDYKQELLKHNRISWHHVEPQRGRSNNSVLLLRNQVTKEEFASIIKKTRQFGEPGFVFGNHPWQLFNPCFEIGFIPVTEDGICGVQFCNLTSINGAKIKCCEDFKAAVEAATIIGTLQATYTNFRYLSHIAKQLTESEALLGVSITGMMDNPDVILDSKLEKEMSTFACKVNEEWSQKLAINQAARITCVKPEGTTSLVLRSASGAHPHHSRRYFRRVQCNKLDPVYRFFKKHNPHACEASVWSENNTDDVITFPVEVSESVMTKDELTALRHLEIIKRIQANWVVPGTTEANKKPITHNVSCTIRVAEHEWEEVIDYIYKNKEFFAAVALLPDCGDKLYKQAPLEKVTEADEGRWKELVSKFSHVDYTQLLEKEDNTVVKQVAACVGGACELV